MKPIVQKLFENNWRIRRRVVFASLSYIAGAVSWIIWKGTDTALYQQIAVTLIGAGTMIIGSYVFGATWDDKNKRDAVSQLEEERTQPSDAPCVSKRTPDATEQSDTPVAANDDEKPEGKNK